jgi:hypothetical protein
LARREHAAIPTTACHQHNGFVSGVGPFGLQCARVRQITALRVRVRSADVRVLAHLMGKGKASTGLMETEARRRHGFLARIGLAVLVSSLAWGSAVAQAPFPDGKPTSDAVADSVSVASQGRPVRVVGWVTHDSEQGWRIGDQSLEGDWTQWADRYVALTAVQEQGDALRATGAVRALAGETIEFRGTIQEMGERFWLINGYTVFVDDRTAITGRAELGALAAVKGTRLAGDSLLATALAIVRPFEYGTVEFEGTLDDAVANAWLVGGVEVAIGAVTALQGIPPWGLEPGPEVLVQIRGVEQPDGSVIAEYAAVRDASQETSLQIEGLVQSIAASQWRIGGRTVLVDARTLVDDSDAPAEVGVWAQARLPSGAGSSSALRIRLSRP